MSVFACISANCQSLNPGCKNLANPWSHVVNLLLEDFGSDLCSAIYFPFFCKAIWDVSVENQSPANILCGTCIDAFVHFHCSCYFVEITGLLSSILWSKVFILL